VSFARISSHRHPPPRDLISRRPQNPSPRLPASDPHATPAHTREQFRLNTSADRDRQQPRLLNPKKLRRRASRRRLVGAATIRARILSGALEVARSLADEQTKTAARSSATTPIGSLPLRPAPSSCPCAEHLTIGSGIRSAPAPFCPSSRAAMRYRSPLARRGDPSPSTPLSPLPRGRRRELPMSIVEEQASPPVVDEGPTARPPAPVMPASTLRLGRA